MVGDALIDLPGGSFCSSMSTRLGMTVTRCRIRSEIHASGRHSQPVELVEIVLWSIEGSTLVGGLEMPRTNCDLAKAGNSWLGTLSSTTEDGLTLCRPSERSPPYSSRSDHRGARHASHVGYDACSPSARFKMDFAFARLPRCSSWNSRELGPSGRVDVDVEVSLVITSQR